ncbi:ABC transporter substrate-binding protein [Candidatus Microgenomates bacterium]|nr:ABC transporter substrate-binding protein [Candidatus Microgenomates bacterium]
MLRRFRISFWFFRAFWEKYFKVIILGLVLGISVFVFYSRFTHLIPQPKKTTKIGFVGRYTPNKLPLSVLEKISRGLVKTEMNGSASPDLAESWEIKDEGKTYTFHLKKGFSWQDGTPLKTEDIHYNLEGVKLEVKNDDTLEFKLNEPFSPFPTILNQPLFKEGFLGLGEYRVTSMKFSGDFVDSLKIESDDALIFKFYPTERAAVLGFKLGEIDELTNITDLSEFETWPNINITPELHQDQFVAVFYNTKDQNLSSKTFRQALTYAIEKPDDKSRALGPLNPNSWTYNNQVKPYDYNLQKAKDLLEESKLTEVEIELTTTFSQLPFAEKIKESWQKLGIKTTVRVISTLPEDFQAFLASQEIPADPDQYTLWHSTQNGNITGYNDPRIDQLLESARKTLDLEERKEKYFDFQRFLVEDVPAAFLFHPTVYTISR